jgi:hypothetical protein
MTNQKHTTNPTGIHEIPKSSVGLRIDRNAKGEIDLLTLESLDLTGITLDPDARIAVIGKARDTERVFDAGTIANRKPIVSETLEGINKAYPFHVRVIVFSDVDKRILASCERLSIYEAEEGSLQSLLPVEPVDLREQLWRLSTVDGDRPILQVSDDIDIGMLERIRHEPLVQALVLPEAIRRALEHLLRNPPSEDDEDKWKGRWERYLEGLGIVIPDDLDDDEDVVVTRAQWIDDAVSQIAIQLKLKTKSLAALPGEHE